MRTAGIPSLLAVVLGLSLQPHGGSPGRATSGGLAGSFLQEDDGGAPARTGPAIVQVDLPAERRPSTLVSPARMLASLAELTAIGREGLFRTSGSSGERAAFDWLEGRLAELRFLEGLGAAVERQPFTIPLSTEVRRAFLALTVDRSEVEVPAHALQGHRDDLAQALRFDSDGRANDGEPDPVVAEGDTVLVSNVADLSRTAPGEFQGRVAVVDFAIVDRGVVSVAAATDAATLLLLREPRAVVLVTRFSNVRGTSHGSFAGDVSVLATMDAPGSPPIVVVRLEDLASAGVHEWGDLARVSRARLEWDSDVFAPGASQLLAFRIPGRDPSRAVLVGAHLDSPNSPGALDDGSGSVALLEAARVLDERGITPPVDTWLLWFGSHERGLYGSSVFATSHGELLDRALAMVQLDCLTHPLDGMDGTMILETQSYAAFGDPRLPLAQALREAAGRHGVGLSVLDAQGLVSDNSSFAGFGVPHTDTIFLSPEMTDVHVDGHLHDPYDDMPLAELHADDLAALATVALAAVRDLPLEPAELRVTPGPGGRAVFVASHTEAVQMTPAQQSLLGMALAWEGLDVDVVPYGTPVTDDDVAGASVVFALPVVDYPSPLAAPEPYDEGWPAGEVEVLRRYVEDGGLLVVPASATRLRYGLTPVEANEDWADVNVLASALGVAFDDRRLTATWATAVGSHPLVQGLGGLALASGNGLAVRAPQGQVLARAGSDVAAAVVRSGNGEVLALADASVLGGQSPATPNLAFMRNLARHARARAASR